MSGRSDFAAFVEDALQPLGPVHIRAMFGGHGVFLDGMMFALIADDALYLKTDGENRPTFEAANLGALLYGGPTPTPYHEAGPARRLAAIEPWIRSAVDAAMRGGMKKRPRRPRG